ncbi:MAG: helix-turn-helix transcriptional regulator [Mycolicibacterium sp.]|nr:helix-turn-helix transcriptional regulator [Mycobacterium sp.]MCB9410222.1 helix-turn-helix transcriptional regulator [Mycolicibacterium sp.]
MKSATSEAELSGLNPDRQWHPVPPTSVRQHLRVLKAAGVATGNRVGCEVCYRLAENQVGDLVLAAVAHAEEGQ